MREILFRGQRADNGEWVYGDLMHKHYNLDTKATKVIHNNLMKYKVIPETVGQYTGLTDKNGKKIFEGDIVKEYSCTGELRDENAVVKWGGFFARWEASGHDMFGEHEIIGNIYENPELLKGGA